MIQKSSPNFTKGRAGQKVEALVIHIMAGSLVGTDDWFSRTESQVSAHYGIGLSGEIHQYVQEENQAWHAGKIVPPTSWKLLKPGVNPNAYTIGIEHEGQDLSKGSEAQLNASAGLIRVLATKYGIVLDRDHIVGHYQIKSSKPNCPATDKSIIDKLIERAKGTEEMTTIQVPTSKVAQLLEYLKTI